MYTMQAIVTSNNLHHIDVPFGMGGYWENDIEVGFLSEKAVCLRQKNSLSYKNKFKKIKICIGNL